MLFDWFTILAQIVNFVILVLLLKRFLYVPVLGAMEDRKKRIAEAMNQAETAQKEALEQSEALTRERQSLLASKEDLLARAKEEVFEWREKALEEVKHEADSVRRSWEARISQDREMFLHNLRMQVAAQVMQISDRVLRDLADESVENRMASVLAARLAQKKVQFPDEDISGDVKVELGIALSPSPDGCASQEKFWRYFRLCRPFLLKKNRIWALD
ncbi:MAG: hypothetical protein R2941_00820 [Desulfobacterales bacterium]